jgi:NAD(P)-dependent dehydrogenase (short-subunit alcohol dehydrogenase family)
VREIEALGRRSILCPDLERAERGPEAIEAVAGELGGLDALINNAGHGTTTPVLEMSLRRSARCSRRT